LITPISHQKHKLYGGCIQPLYQATKEGDDGQSLANPKDRKHGETSPTPKRKHPPNSEAASG